MNPSRSSYFTPCALACALAVCSIAMAADKPPTDGADLFKAMDANGDGRISPEEHAAGARKMFDGMDANKDRKVTAAEMDAAHEKMTGRKAGPKDLSSAEKIKVIDRDGDGILTAEEHASGSKAMFEKMDTDRDGFTSRPEQTAAHARMLHKP